MIKFVYFDFNNVLAQQSVDQDLLAARALGMTEEQHFQYYQQVKTRLNLRNLRADIRNSGDERLYFELIGYEILKLAKMPVHIETIKDYVKARLKPVFHLKPGVKQTLPILAKHFGLGIISNGRPSRRYNEIDRLGLTKSIPHENIIISLEVGHSKPEREIYQLAVKQANCNPNQIVFCDDKPKFLTAARKAGIGHTVLFSSQQHEHFFTVRQNFAELLKYPAIKDSLHQ